MNVKTKFYATCLASSLVLGASITNAQTILGTNFDGNVIENVSGNGGANITSIDYTVGAGITLLDSSGNLPTDVTDAGDITAITGGRGFSRGNQTPILDVADNVYVNQNLNSGNDQGFYMNFRTDSDIAIGGLDILSGHLSGGGGDQSGSSTLNFQISSLSSGVVVGDPLLAQSTSVDYSNSSTPTFVNTAFTFSETLAAGDYRLSIFANNLSITGAFFGSDGFALTAAVIPEPSTYAALFGGIMLGIAVVRRRKTRAAA